MHRVVRFARRGGRGAALRASGAMPPARRASIRSSFAVALVALAVTSCARFGEATIRIDEAEEEIEALTGEIVDVIDLEITADTPLGQRESCELVTAADGASNRLAVRGPIPEDIDVLNAAAAVLTEANYQLVPGDRDDELFGRRDGIRITVALDRATDEVAIDANTACRALPR